MGKKTAEQRTREILSAVAEALPDDAQALPADEFIGTTYAVHHLPGAIPSVMTAVAGEECMESVASDLAVPDPSPEEAARAIMVARIA